MVLGLTFLQTYANVVLEVNKAKSLFEIIAEKKKEVKRMEEEMKGNGMANGVCIGFRDTENPTIIMVKNRDPKKLEGFYGLPGGVIEAEESPTSAMVREWKEEVGGQELEKRIDLYCSIVIKRRNYEQHVFFIKDNGQKLRTKGVLGEVGPPERIKLTDVIFDRVSVFYSHLELIYPVIRKMASEHTMLAVIATKLAKKLGKNIEAGID